jgi:hypothetical protein
VTGFRSAVLGILKVGFGESGSRSEFGFTCELVPLVWELLLDFACESCFELCAQAAPGTAHVTHTAKLKMIANRMHFGFLRTESPITLSGEQ